jgi:hypothetical protein
MHPFCRTSRCLKAEPDRARATDRGPPGCGSCRRGLSGRGGGKGPAQPRGPARRRTGRPTPAEPAGPPWSENRGSPSRTRAAATAAPVPWSARPAQATASRVPRATSAPGRRASSSPAPKRRIPSAGNSDCAGGPAWSADPMPEVAWSAIRNSHGSHRPNLPRPGRIRQAPRAASPRVVESRRKRGVPSRRFTTGAF